MKLLTKFIMAMVCVLGTTAAAQTTYLFGTCGAIGATGPTQAACDVAYTATNLSGLVTVSGGIQEWTVPNSGTYRIEVLGAQGESGAANSGFAGGRGASMEGDIVLAAGQVLQIVVGQMGLSIPPVNGGGGGGSFVVDMATVTPLIIASGGGGTRIAAQQNGCDGRISQEGGTGRVATTHNCSQKGGGIGFGGIVTGRSWGSGGGGFLGDGQDDSPWGQGGRAFVNGAAGGDLRGCGVINGAGGFGGGGDGSGCGGGGGGGGYSGGDGGFIAGGGGSFNIGSNQIAAIGIGIGDGSVSITILDSDGDGVDDSADLCPNTAPNDPVDTVGCSDVQVDADGDGVCDLDAASGGPSECTGVDVCAGTDIPESVPLTGKLNPNHWALTDFDFEFDTVLKGKGKGPGRSYTTADTAGCSCEQIIVRQGLGNGHTKFGCSISAMDDWVEFVNQ